MYICPRLIDARCTAVRGKVPISNFQYCRLTVSVINHSPTRDCLLYLCYSTELVVIDPILPIYAVFWKFLPELGPTGHCGCRHHRNSSLRDVYDTSFIITSFHSGSWLSALCFSWDGNWLAIPTLWPTLWHRVFIFHSHRNGSAHVCTH